jgi:predicted enzyme related to lactoylglutathione lyase
LSLGPLDHVWFWTSDMDAAVGFYTDLLGLTLVTRYGNEWAELDAGPIRLGLHGSGDGGPLPNAGTVVFRVTDLDATKAGLEERGVAFDGHLGEVPGVGRYASFSDPDGNALQLFEYVGDPGSSRSERERASGSPPGQDGGVR